MSTHMIFPRNIPIKDILLTMPEASEIFMSYGLSCAECSFNEMETLEQGVLGHGFDETTLEQIMLDLNDAANELGLSSVQKNELPPPQLSFSATEYIQELIKEKKWIRGGLRIEVTIDSDANYAYFLDIEEKPKKEDRVIESNHVFMFLSEESLKYLRGYIIDYVRNGESEGFSIRTDDALSLLSSE